MDTVLASIIGSGCRAIIAAILWGIWKIRNKCQWEGVKAVPVVMMREAMSLLDEYQAAHSEGVGHRAPMVDCPEGSVS